MAKIDASRALQTATTPTKGGSLAIPFANLDAHRMADFINTHKNEIKQIVLTLDSHQRYHIAHGIFWKDSNGVSPEPFTVITCSDIEKGIWMPRQEELREYTILYTRSLEDAGKSKLTIWPEHCIIGTRGHNIQDNVHAAVLDWTKESMIPVKYIMKGMSSFTEHYSALKADVVLAHDLSTQFNEDMYTALLCADRVVVCGQALSHCVNYTMRDLVDVWPRDRITDLYLLSDCSTPVPGFEAIADAFVEDMKKIGVRVMIAASFT